MTLQELKDHVDRLIAEGVPLDAKMYCEGGYVPLEWPHVDPVPPAKSVIW